MHGLASFYQVTPYEIFIDVIDEHGDIFDRVSAR